MPRYLFIGDLHGQLTLTLHLREQFPTHRLVFLGDYLDSFSQPIPQQIRLLRTILDWRKANEVDALFGNHEDSYLFPSQRASGWKAQTAQSVLLMKDEMLNSLQRLLFLPPNILVTHAGVSSNWCSDFQIDPINLVEALQVMAHRVHSPFYAIGKARNGDAECGGPMWCDWNTEFVPLEGLIQIVGHTASTQDTPFGFDQTFHGHLRQSDNGDWNIDCLRENHSLQILEWTEDGLFHKLDVP